MSYQSTRISIIDDHTLFREGLISILNDFPKPVEVFEFSSAKTFLESSNFHKTDIAIIDISLPEKNGLTLLKELTQQRSSIKPIILSLFSAKDYGLQAIKFGAMAYLNKATASEELFTCLNTVMDNKMYLTSEISLLLATNYKSERDNPPHLLLSSRELEVLQLLGEGFRPIDIAKKLFLSIKTISTYKARIFNRLHFKNNNDLITYCMRHHIIDSPVTG